MNAWQRRNLILPSLTAELSGYRELAQGLSDSEIPLYIPPSLSTLQHLGLLMHDLRRRAEDLGIEAFELEIACVRPSRGFPVT